MVRVRSWWCWLALVGAATAAAEESDEWIRGTYTGGSPRAIEAPAAHAWLEASTLAEQTDGAFVLVGSGDSMRPLYQPGTILVLRRVAFDELQRGQTVLYRNQRHKIVAHVLVARTRDGWRARGLNNRQHDMEPILEENCVGVVIAAYHPTDPAPEMQLAGMP